MSSTENAFEQLHPDVQHHIVNSLGWQELRAVQEMAIGPVLEGRNCVVLAPTAGGKTEAVFFPLMSRMLEEEWEGLSVIYLSPIKALLNNQMERLERLFGMIGREVGVWHGDVPASAKKRMRENPPHVLLTTPESLEGMLISRRTNSSGMFGSLQVVVIDEVHAFAGDDRGWHLLGVLNRLSTYAGRDVQRLGLSATVGNREEIVEWLSSNSERQRATVDPPRPEATETDVTLDWVASLSNAAQIISQLHRGERRLVFCDSRIQCEKLTRELRKRGVTTHVVHSSLSTDERRLAERQFAEGGPGVIVATSALELGIDIGSLDRVIQIDSPYTVASFLQRMGRTGRRPGTVPNMLFLAISDPGLWRAASVLTLWRRGFVEPARAPEAPYHILAQQMLAVGLERPGITVPDFVERVAPFAKTMRATREELMELYDHLNTQEYLYSDGVRIGVGREAESEFGARNFLELVSVFTTPPIFKVVWNQRELGEVDQANFVGFEEDDAKIILLAGRSWIVTDISWTRRIAYVEPFDQPGDVSWMGSGPVMSFELASAHRDVITGNDDTSDLWSKRARQALEELRNQFTFVAPDGTTVVRLADALEIWTFAGGFANRVLAARFRESGVEKVSADALRVRIAKSMLLRDAESMIGVAQMTDRPLRVDEDNPMLNQLKFRELLPASLLQHAGGARIYGDGQSTLVEQLGASTSLDLSTQA